MNARERIDRRGATAKQIAHRKTFARARPGKYEKRTPKTTTSWWLDYERFYQIAAEKHRARIAELSTPDRATPTGRVA